MGEFDRALFGHFGLKNMTPKKYDLLYLQPQDELPVVIDYLRSTSKEVVVIVAPERHALLESLVNLKLLVKTAQKVKKKLVLVTADPIAQRIATQVEVKTYDRLLLLQKAYGEEEKVEKSEKTDQDKKKANISHSKTDFLETSSKTEQLHELDEDSRKANNSRKKSSAGFFVKFTAILKNQLDNVTTWWESKQNQDNESSEHFQKRLIVGVLVIFCSLILMVGIYAYVKLPYGRVVIVPKTESFREVVEFRVSDRFEEMNYLSNQVPAASYEVVESRSATAKPTTNQAIGTKAVGRVSIFNDGYSYTIVLAKGTKVISYSGQEFVLDSTVEVPALRVEGGEKIPGQVSNVPVTAVLVGEESNIRSNNFTIEGYDDGVLWAESYEDFSGGVSRTGVVVGQDDIDQLRTKILQELLPETESKVRGQLNAGHEFVSGSIESTLIKEEVSAQVGQEVESFSISLTVRSRAMSVKTDDLQLFMQQKIRDAVPNYAEAVGEDGWGVEYQLIQLTDNYREATMQGVGTGQLRLKISPQEIINQVAGKNEVDAGIYLDSYQEEVSQYKIEYGPFWVKALPKDVDRIELEIVSQEEFGSRYE